MTGPWKTCADCQERKPWSEYWPKAKWPDGSMRQPHAYCKDCFRRRTREWRKRKKHADPDYFRVRNAAEYRKDKRDPERLARRRERNRQAQRRQHNIPPERWRVLPVDGERNDWLPIEPFRDWLLGEVADRGSLKFVSELSGIAERQIYRWLREGEVVNLDLVDRVLCACDQPEVLRDLYPDLYAEQEAAA